MWLVKLFSTLYLTAVCAAKDHSDAATYVYTDASPTSPLPRLTVVPVYELPAPSLQLKTNWLDVFPSEKVDFSCHVTNSSDWTFTWSLNGQKVQDSDPNVSLSNEGSMLTITASSQMSGNYTCSGRHKTKNVNTATSKSLTLHVYSQSPKPTVQPISNLDMVFTGESVTFTCTIDVSSGWDFLWYHNGNDIQSTGSTYTINSINDHDRGEYHCQARRGKYPFYTEASNVKNLQVFALPKPSLKLLTPWTDVFENETLTFSCEVDDSDWMFSWYRNQERLQELDAEEPYLNITSIMQIDQGGYSCKVEHFGRKVSSGFSNTIDITVYENTPKPKLSKEPGFNQMYASETTKFTCNVDVSSGWEYQWYKDGYDLNETNKTINIPIGPSAGGKYSCQATRGKTTSTEISEEIQQVVVEIPVPSLRLMTSWLDVFPAETVEMSCGMGNSSDWTYTWYKDFQEVKADKVVSFDSNKATLSIYSASTDHAGQYVCMGHLKGRSVSSSSSSPLRLVVYDKKPRVIVTQDPDYRVMFPGESVSFSCHINVSSGWEYLWYQDSKSLGASGNTLTISLNGAANQGSYKCQAKRGTNQKFLTDNSQAVHLKVDENKPKPSITQQPDIDKVYTGESVSLKCEIELTTGWEYSWHKDGRPLLSNSSSLNIARGTLLDGGTYECMGKRRKTMHETVRSDKRILHVSEIPVPSLKLMTGWLDVFASESVKLSCRMDDSFDWNYTWYKDGQQVHADDAISLHADLATLTISAASTLHRGQYSCSGHLKSRSVNSTRSSELTLHVYGTKPAVQLVQSPSNSVMHTGDSVSFSCHINVSSGWEFLWYKDGTQLVESGNNHTILSVLTRNTGSYSCQTRRGRNVVFLSPQSQAVKLDVKERPKAAIVLLTGWSEVFFTDSLALRCGVQESQDMWNYTWFKEGQPVNGTSSERHIVKTQDDPEQSLYTCQGIRAGSPSYSEISDQFKTKNLLLNRRVLLSVASCILLGITITFIGCCCLKVIHKPADDYNPEADLFLSMDRLKNSDDVPCPLFQYITNEALNASPKEVDDNGIICSETTPLPITTQGEEDLTTANLDATESNGGLVSFKQ